MKAVNLGASWYGSPRVLSRREPHSRRTAATASSGSESSCMVSNSAPRVSVGDKNFGEIFLNP
jgi:hypothetical protein